MFPCLGEDQWITIAVANDVEWQALKDAMGNPAWAESDDFGDAFQRWQNQDILEARLSEWTASRTASELTTMLQDAGTAAFPSLSADRLMDDPHLAARNAFPANNSPDQGRAARRRAAMAFLDTPTDPLRWTPDLGEHNHDVFCGLLGMDKAELAALQAAQIVW